MLPTGKMTIATLAGALTIILMAEAQRWGVTIDGTEGSSITTVLMFIAGYLAPKDAPAP